MAAPMARALRFYHGQTFSKTSGIIDKIKLCINCRQEIKFSSRINTESTEKRITKAANQTQKISQAMRFYLENAKAHDAFFKEEIAEYEIGKRHLANIMGKDVNNFEQSDIDMAIEYLLPSGLFNKKARPKMKHPTEVIPKRKAAQFGLDGRPFHHFFYTTIPNYYELMHTISAKIDELNIFEDKMHSQGQRPTNQHTMIVAGTTAVEKKYLEEKLQEKLTDVEFKQFELILTRLIEEASSNREKEFIMQYRKSLVTQNLLEDVAPLLHNEAGRPYMTAEGKRKTALVQVTVTGQGVGQAIINGKDILDHFPLIKDREQIMFPLQLTGLLGEVDIEAAVQLGGPSSQAGAVRLAVSRALQSFVDKQMCEKMRLAGLLTKDPRVRERKKPGQAGARKKFTWKKR